MALGCLGPQFPRADKENHRQLSRTEIPVKICSLSGSRGTGVIESRTAQGKAKISDTSVAPPNEEMTAVTQSSLAEQYISCHLDLELESCGLHLDWVLSSGRNVFKIVRNLYLSVSGRGRTSQLVAHLQRECLSQTCFHRCTRTFDTNTGVETGKKGGELFRRFPSDSFVLLQSPESSLRTATACVYSTSWTGGARGRRPARNCTSRGTTSEPVTAVPRGVQYLPGEGL